jgi:hypothetical protein
VGVEVVVEMCPKCMGTGRVHSDSVVGAYMKRARLSAGLTLKEFSEKSGLSTTYLNDLEHGRRRWCPGLVIELLADIFG